MPKLKPADVAELLRSGVTKKVPDGNSLYLSVRAGRAYWQHQFRDGAVIRSHCLGIAPQVTPAEARKRREQVSAARREQRPLPTWGKGPAGRRPAVAQGATFREWAAKYLADKSGQWRPATEARMKRLIEQHAKPLLDRPVASITSEMVADACRPIWKGPARGLGADLRSLVERVLQRAGILDQNPAEWDRLRSHLRENTDKVTSHEALPSADAPALMARLLAIGTDAARCIAWIMATGARRNEAIDMPWEEIDPEALEWRRPAWRLKGKEDHTVMLTPAMLALLGERKTGPAFGTNRSQVNSLMRQFHPTATLHGMRSMLYDWGPENGFSEAVMDVALAHKEIDKVRAAYKRTDFPEQRRKLAQAWSAFMLRSPTGNRADNSRTGEVGAEELRPRA